MNAARGPVVVVLGRPDDTLLTSLRTVGLTPIAEDGQAVVWGPPPPRPPAIQVRPADQAPAVDRARLLMTIRDAALALGLGRSTVYELIGRGELEVVHVGRSARIPVDALRRFVDRRRVIEGTAAGDQIAS
jgi:excisionase family DNA binding protein